MDAANIQGPQRAQAGESQNSIVGDTVFEVGPGTGVLTMKLLASARKVIALDVDQAMLREVRNRAESLRLLRAEELDGAETFARRRSLDPNIVDPFGLHRAGITNLELLHGDVLTNDLPKAFDVCVANLPYQISSKFLFKLLHHLARSNRKDLNDKTNNSLTSRLSEESPRPWKRSVLMFQTEFVNRLLAEPGERKFNRLSMNARLFVEAEKICTVKGGSFIPQPQVESTVVRLTPRRVGTDVLAGTGIDFVEWDALTRMLFMRRRRTVHGTIRVRCIQRQLERHYMDWCTLHKELPRLSYFKEECRTLVGEVGPYAAYILDIDPLIAMLKRFHAFGIYLKKC